MRTILVLLVAAFFWPLSFAAAQKAIPQGKTQAEIDAIIQDLRSPDRMRRMEGANAYYSVPEENRTPTLWAAIVAAKHAEDKFDREIFLGLRPPLEWDEKHDFDWILTDAVVALKDPATIPVLIYGLHPGITVGRPMADWGRRALPALLAAAEKPAHEYQLGGALVSLRMMVDRWGLAYFTSEERAALTRIAGRYLDVLPEGERVPGKYVFPGSYITYAMHLAIVLEDEELRKKVMFLATADVEEFWARGERDEGFIRIVRKEAHLLLAGEPPKPYYDDTLYYK